MSRCGMKFGCLVATLLATLLLGLTMMEATAETTGQLVEINEQNWEDEQSHGEWMVEFFAPWCPACNRFESTWKEFAAMSGQLQIRVGSADVNANPVLSGLFSVTSLPTIYHIREGQYRVYAGNRELVNLVDFVRNKEWEKLEPSSSWLTPNSFIIKSVSKLFKLTIYFKDLYTQLTEKQGYPMWAVLTLFVVITIALGLLLGVLFVLVIDCVCPPKRSKVFDELKDSSEGDIANDTMCDDSATADNNDAPLLPAREAMSKNASHSSSSKLAQKKKSKKDN